MTIGMEPWTIGAPSGAIPIDSMLSEAWCLPDRHGVTLVGGHWAVKVTRSSV